MKIIRHLLACFALSCVVSVAGADTLRTVAFSGDAAPGTEGVFTSVGSPSLNNQGQIAFVGDLAGAGVDDTNDKGIWSEGNGSLALVARAGNQALGTGGDFAPGFILPVLNDSGQTAFYSRFTWFTDQGNFSSNQQGIWSGGDGSLALEARSGNEAPGTDEFFGSFFWPVFNDNGHMAVRIWLNGPGVMHSNARGIWRGRNGSSSLIAREGSEAPGSNESFVSLDDPVINSMGQVAFHGKLTGGGRARNGGIWSEGGGTLALVVHFGDPAPGTNTFFSAIVGGQGNITLNDAGQTAFLGVLTGEGIDSSNNTGIWSKGDGPISLVVREGNEAPGTNVNFSRFDSLVLNGAGQTAFVGKLTGNGVDGSNDDGIWSEGNGHLSLVAREGDEAPGTDASFLWVGDVFVLNRAGQVAFTGGLDSNDTGIWAQSPSGVLTLIAREGGQLDVDDGPGIDLRTISELGFSATNQLSTGNEDGRVSGFNDRGQLAFQATFTDGTSGIFVSNLVAIPEPASSMLLLAALAICGVRRCRP